jgi:RimJ/RimL family protein N-acetyltransferase
MPQNEKHITIRKVQKGDLKSFFRWWNDKELMAAVLAEHFSIDMKTLLEEYWPAWEHPSPTGSFMSVICLNEKPIGEICHTIEGDATRLADIHMKIAEPSLWRKGYGKQALKAYVEMLFEKQGMRCAQVRVGSHNKPMQGLCLHLGFSEISRVELNEVLGKRHDDLQVITYELTPEK